MNVIQEVRSFYGGISNQHPSLRVEHQVEDSINCVHTIDRGTLRRNPTKLLSGNTLVPDDSWNYSYSRGEQEQSEEYMFTYDDENGLRVIDLINGDIVSVAGNAATTTYLEANASLSSVANRFAATTIKDVTYIVNRNVTTQMVENISTDETGSEAYIWIKATDAVAGYTFTTVINGTSVNATGTTTYAVAQNLSDAINTAAISNITSTYSDNIIRVSTVDDTDITSLTLSDSFGNQASGLLWRYVSSQNDLPKSMGSYTPTIKVGDLNSATKQYWLYFNGTIWVEARSPDANYQFDSTTMPHIIIRASDGTFSITPIIYAERLVGDETNAPAPKFIGERITDIFFFKNRAGILSETTVCFTEVGYYDNFFPTTQITVLDSDRIDAPLDSKQAFRLKYIAFIQDEIVIFGSDIQFAISHSGSFTPKTIYARQISNYSINENVRPISIDDKIFFTTTRQRAGIPEGSIQLSGGSSQVFIYTKDSSGLVNRATTITSHVSELLDVDVSQIVGSSANGMVFFRSETEQNIIYVYKYMVQGNEMVQSSWFKWRFTGSIYNIHCKGNILWMSINRQDVLDDDIWAVYSAEWNDLYSWDDDKIWADSIGTSNDNIEFLNIDPVIQDTYLDIGLVNYSSDILLTQYIPKYNNKSDNSSNVYIKTAKVLGNIDSTYELTITNTERNKTRKIPSLYATNKKPYIMGNAKNIDIKISSKSFEFFQINGILYESKINNRSRNI